MAEELCQWKLQCISTCESSRSVSIFKHCWLRLLSSEEHRLGSQSRRLLVRDSGGGGFFGIAKPQGCSGRGYRSNLCPIVQPLLTKAVEADIELVFTSCRPHFPQGLSNTCWSAEKWQIQRVGSKPTWFRVGALLASGFCRLKRTHYCRLREYGSCNVSPKSLGPGGSTGLSL